MIVHQESPAECELRAPDFGLSRTNVRWSREGLVKQGYDKTDEWMLEGTAPKPENFQLVVPGEDGLEVIFSSYQVAPYAAGTPSVEIPWSVAWTIFKEAYRP